MPNWNEVLNELTAFDKKAATKQDIVRRKYLKKLQRKTGRNVIAYYSGYMSKPGIHQSSIIDEDKNGFMMAMHKLDYSLGLDLMLHTPGGSISAAQSIVDYLRQKFGTDIRAIVPQQAMSAGTMIACACREILMARHSNLGPIDPQIGGLPAYGFIEEFHTACEEIKQDPSRIPMWNAIISQYNPTLLSQCKNAIDWSNDFVEEQITNVMLAGEKDARTRAKSMVKKLTDYSGNKRHERHIHFDECAAMGLKVTLIEDDDELQDLVLTVHHCYIHVMMNASPYKIIENHKGQAIVRHLRG